MSSCLTCQQTAFTGCKLLQFICWWGGNSDNTSSCQLLNYWLHYEVFFKSRENTKLWEIVHTCFYANPDQKHWTAASSLIDFLKTGNNNNDMQSACVSTTLLHLHLGFLLKTFESERFQVLLSYVRNKVKHRHRLPWQVTIRNFGKHVIIVTVRGSLSAFLCCREQTHIKLPINALEAWQVVCLTLFLMLVCSLVHVCY